MAERTDSDDVVEWHPRVDRGALLRPVVRADGSLLVEGYAAREGVLEYRRADGSTFREFVPAETLRDSAKGLARAPVTLEHPREDVTPDNVGALGVGDTDGEVEVEDGGFVRVRLAVRRRDAVDDVRSKRRTELSPGYRVRLDPTPGEHPVHGRYDAVQVERVYNHLAIVERARGGASIRMRTDAVDGPPVAVALIERRTDTNAGPEAHGARMDPALIRLLSLLGIHQRTDTNAEAINLSCNAIERQRETDATAAAEQQARVDSLTRELAAERAKVAAAETARATAEGERDALRGRADAAEAETARLRQADQERADAAERVKLETLAKALKVDPKRHDSLPALRLACAVAHYGGALPQTDDGYVAGVLGMAYKRADAETSGREAGRQAWQTAQDAAGAEQRADAQGDRQRRRSPGAASLARYRDAFEQGRS